VDLGDWIWLVYKKKEKTLYINATKEGGPKLMEAI
jgi:hypothetical protein